MQDTAVERLSKIIADPHPGSGGPGKNGRVPGGLGFHWHLALAEGWFSLFLLATVVFSTIWCVEAAGWVANLNILSLTTLLGLICGVLAAKQRRLTRFIVHPIALVVGLLLALWQTAGADYGGDVSALLRSMHQWLMIALAGGSSSDDSIFLFFIIALSFLLAYTSAWLVYRTRKPWLMILANAVVLLINLNNIDSGYIVFLVVFLVAALLLALRFNLYESSVRWKQQGLRCADDLGWEFMQVGALISIGILVFAWILPWGYTNGTAEQIWSADNNPWVQFQDTWNRLISVSGGENLANRGNFTDTLVLGGNPHLNNEIVFNVKINGDGQYLESLSYDTYNGRGWNNGQTVGTTLKANTISYDGSQDLNPIRQDITVVNPPGEQYPYLFGASQIASANQAAQLLGSKANGSAIAWLLTNGRLAAGGTYTVVSYISGADVKTLQTVPLPVDAPPFIPNPARPDSVPPVTYYDPNILKTYLQLPGNLDPNIKILAEQITAGAHTMYDKAVALESYLQNNYTYDVNISLPPGEEGVSWLLFRSQHRTYCTYSATAMAVMARELGIPARVVSGYTSGKFDSKKHEWVIRGSDAHSWVQIYFAGYGWINFEPSHGFSSFTRPITSSNASPGIVSNGSNSSQTGKANHPKSPELTSSGDTSGALTAAQQQEQLRQDISLAIAGLILLILSGVIFFGIWWRRLYQGYGLPAQIYGRICTLANWAGLSKRPSQTPYEYMNTLEEAAPDQASTLERMGDIYVRDRWADPSSTEHPRRTGEIAQLPDMWKRLQPRLFLYVLRHPYFLRSLPAWIGSLISKRKSRKRVSRLPDDVITIED